MQLVITTRSVLFQVQILVEIQIHVVHQIILHVTSNKHCLHRAQNPDLTFSIGCNIIIAHISHIARKS